MLWPKQLTLLGQASYSEAHGSHLTCPPHSPRRHLFVLSLHFSRSRVLSVNLTHVLHLRWENVVCTHSIITSIVSPLPSRSMFTIYFLMLFPLFQFSRFHWFDQVVIYSVLSLHLESFSKNRFLPFPSPQIPHDYFLLEGGEPSTMACVPGEAPPVLSFDQNKMQLGAPFIYPLSWPSMPGFPSTIIRTTRTSSSYHLAPTTLGILT